MKLNITVSITIVSILFLSVVFATVVKAQPCLPGGDVTCNGQRSGDSCTLTDPSLARFGTRGTCRFTSSARTCACQVPASLINNTTNFVLDGPVCFPLGCSAPGTFEPDSACVTKQILNPRAKDPGSGEFCCINKCVGAEPSAAGRSGNEFVNLINIFGTNVISINSEQRIAAIINLALTSVLGAISAYTIIRGIKITAFDRPRTLDPGEIAGINKTLVTLVIGFVLAWSFIFIIQLVSNFLGVGSLNDLILVGAPPEDTTTITIT